MFAKAFIFPIFNLIRVFGRATSPADNADVCSTAYDTPDWYLLQRTCAD